jgi:small subunit ribosomal protein S8
VRDAVEEAKAMYVTDPIADMLTRIRNANMVFHDTVEMPLSKAKLAIAKILKEEGYVKNFRVINDPKKPFPILRLYLHYGPEKQRIIQGLRRISKPGRRIYVRKDELPRVLRGLGTAIISTSQGMMTDSEARRQGLGGEVICYVW